MIIVLFIAFALFAIYQSMQINDKKEETQAVALKELKQQKVEQSVPEEEKKIAEEIAKEKPEEGKKNAEKGPEQVVEVKEEDIGGATTKESAVIQDEALTAALNTTYTNATYAYSLNYPDSWGFTEAAPEQVGFAPKGKAVDSQYQGDIVLTVKSNPEGLTVQEFYNGANDVNLFTDATGGSAPRSIGGREAWQFTGVEGYVPSTVVVVPLGDAFLEITDVGAQHVDDGLFDRVTASVVVE